MDATFDFQLAADAKIITETERLRDDMRRDHGLNGYVAVTCMAHSTGLPAHWDAYFSSAGIHTSIREMPTALDAINALRDAIAEKLAEQPSLDMLAKTLGCEVPK